MSLGGAWVGARPAQTVRSQALFVRGFACRDPVIFHCCSGKRTNPLFFLISFFVLKTCCEDARGFAAGRRQPQSRKQSRTRIALARSQPTQAGAE